MQIPIEQDRWEHYHVKNDFSESADLASQQPKRLELMKKLWWSETKKNGALPLLEAPRERSRTYDQAITKR